VLFLKTCFSQLKKNHKREIVLIKLKLLSYKINVGQKGRGNKYSLIEVWGQHRITSKKNTHVTLYYEGIWKACNNDFEEFVEMIDRVYLTECFCAQSKCNDWRKHRKIKCNALHYLITGFPNQQFICVFDFLAHAAQDPSLIKNKLNNPLFKLGDWSYT
jgi:hypothetical protein